MKKIIVLPAFFLFPNIWIHGLPEHLNSVLNQLSTIRTLSNLLTERPAKLFASIRMHRNQS